VSDGSVRRPFAAVSATPREVAAARPGDGVVPRADVVMDRAFDLPAPPEQVWPWLVQLGKRRAGWYLPRAVERLVPPSRRAAREVLPRWQQLAVGDVVPDWGGTHATFEVLEIAPARHLVYGSTRGSTRLTWAIVLRPQDAGPGNAGTRVHLRLRLAPVRRVRLAESVGGLVDALTVAGMAAGLAERLDRS
jgi:hypothetical protein